LIAASSLAAWPPLTVCSSVKATAERLAQEDGRSLANWLERMIEAEAARQDGKK
jgi:hypothetical protein